MSNYKLKRYSANKVRALLKHIALPVLSLPIVADGVEHGNSTYKWVQAGRVRLGDETAAKLVYCIINVRMLENYRKWKRRDKVPGAYKLNRGWPEENRSEEEEAEEGEKRSDVAVLRLQIDAVLASEEASEAGEGAAEAEEAAPSVQRARRD